MEEVFYNVLWIDDEHETLTGTKGRAKRNGINLLPFKSLNSGMDELENNYPFYDAVLLDAKFFENEDDLKGTEDTYNVHRAKERLLLLKKKFEVFVLTGQAEAYEDKTFKKAFTKVYKKGSDLEINRLFSDIKEAAATQEDTQIRHIYKRVFDVCTEQYIGLNAAHDLLELLKYDGCETVKFNQMRKIIEDLFFAFLKHDLLPCEFFKPNPAVSEISKFLAGQVTVDAFANYKLKEESIIPKQISELLKNIILLTHSGSHRGKVDAHINSLKTPYLFKSVLFQLLDVLVWFKQYIDSKPKTKNWESLEADNDASQNETWIEGEVINYNNIKGFAFLSPFNGSENQFIPPNLVTSFSLTNGCKVKGEIEEYIDNRTGDPKTRIKNIEFI